MDRKHLATLIQNYCNTLSYDICIKIFVSVEDLVAYYEDEDMDFDIVFLDIYMDGDNGIKTAQKIRKFDSQCKIIFTTTSTDYALDSFKVLPFNYLTKPITKEVFNAILEKAIFILTRKNKRA